MDIHFPNIIHWKDSPFHHWMVLAYLLKTDHRYHWQFLTLKTTAHHSHNVYNTCCMPSNLLSKDGKKYSCKGFRIPQRRSNRNPDPITYLITVGIHSEKCIERLLYTLIVCTYTNLDGMAHYTPRLCGIAYPKFNCLSFRVTNNTQIHTLAQIKARIINFTVFHLYILSLEGS